MNDSTKVNSELRRLRAELLRRIVANEAQRRAQRDDDASAASADEKAPARRRSLIPRPASGR